MTDHDDQVIARITRTMREWHGNENLDNYHRGILSEMVTFASFPITVGVLDTPEKIIIQLNEITQAAFNLGYAKGRSE